MTPTFQGEVLMRRWSDSSTQGVQITFALQDASDLEPLKTKTGKRFMAVLVEIGDDEKPVLVNPTPVHPREYLGDLCYRAVQWCNDPEFQRWIVERADLACKPSAQIAKETIYVWCGVLSRKELDTNPEAAEKFNRLIRGPYQKHLQARGLV